MNKEQWIQTNARAICDAILKDYEENGNLYCSSYTTDDGKFNIFVDQNDGYIEIALSDNETLEVICKKNSKINHRHIYATVAYLLGWLEEEELI